MLKRLSVENYALIDKLDIEFAPQVNIITGETGAGKSILLGALSLVLGGRADAGVIKDESRNCVVECEFDLTSYTLQPLFEGLDLEYSPLTVIRRVITPAGKSRAYINDMPVQLTALREVGQQLIDIHSQHQTLLLGENHFQVDTLDSVAQHGTVLVEYRTKYEQLLSCERELDKLRKAAAESSQDRAYVTFQLEQLLSAHLQAGEQEDLEGLLSELTHALEIQEAMLQGAELLDGDEENVITRLKFIEQSVGKLQEVFPVSGEYATRLRTTLLELKDLSAEMHATGERIEADPKRLGQTEERLDTLYTLQQKHKCQTVDELLSLQADYENRLENIEGYQQAIEEKSRQLAQRQKEAQRLAERISAGRRKAQPVIEQHVCQMLSELGMPSAQLQIEIIPASGLSTTGGDAVRFLFSANRNIAPQAIEKVASGGEMSRLMLTLKALIAGHTNLPTVIFDEIDTGVSGAIADKMGEIIVSLSERLQIINITHLPQVAAKGNDHFFVYKEESAQTTATHIRRLSTEERIDEIAKMLSGSNVTEAARTQARLLLREE